MSLTTESGTEFFDAETAGQKPHFRLAETDTETNVDSKSPRSAGQMHGYRAGFDTYGLGGGDGMVRTGCLSNRVSATRLDRCDLAFAPRGVRIGTSA